MAIVPAISFAGDFWSETPDLNHNIKSEFNLNQPIFFNNNTSQVGMWSETPDLNSPEKKFETDLNTHVISPRDVNPGMYSETPDLTPAFISRPVNG